MHHRDPYNRAVTREVQIWAYGYIVGSDGTQRQDENRFVYPLYFALLLAPLVRLSFETVQVLLCIGLPLFVLGTVLLWIKAIRWPAHWRWLVVICLLSLTNFPMLESLYLQQPGLFAAAFLAGSCAALVSGRAVLSGVLLACSTIKPQLTLFVALWLMFWGVANWARRKKLVFSFAATVFVFVGVSELLVRGWVREFVGALIAYQRYNNTSSILSLLLGRAGGIALAAALLVVLMLTAWRARHELAGSERFTLILCATLSYTVVVMPTMYPTAQITLLPVIFLIVKAARRIWAEGRVMRLLLVALFCLLGWPWIGAGTLFLLHLALPVERLRNAWEVVLAPVILLPSISMFLLLLYASKSVLRLREISS